MKFFVLVSFLIATTLASPYKSFQTRDWSSIKPKVAVVQPKTANYAKETDEPTNPVRVQPVRNNRDVCGVLKTESEGRISGGVEVAAHAYPWQVGIIIDGTRFCGGTFISEIHVLTSATCTNGASYFDVILGAHNISDVTEESRIEVRTTDFIQHEGYVDYMYSNDISIIYLPAPVTFTAEIAPICLPSPQEVGNTFVGEPVILTGWGSTKFEFGSTELSPVLREATVPVLSTETCNLYYFMINDAQLCTDATGGKAVCYGDLGGPMQLKAADGRWETIGISSFTGYGGCEAGNPDVFTRITSHLDWIALHTGLAY